MLKKWPAGGLACAGGPRVETSTNMSSLVLLDRAPCVPNTLVLPARSNAYVESPPRVLSGQSTYLSPRHTQTFGNIRGRQPQRVTVDSDFHVFLGLHVL